MLFACGAMPQFFLRSAQVNTERTIVRRPFRSGQHEMCSDDSQCRISLG
jgi:hypothetical protein